MAKCYVCGAQYFEQTRDATADPCDCGQCVGALAWQDMTPLERETAQREWQIEQEAARAEQNAEERYYAPRAK